jgi:biopolymer transport protein ExbD
MAEISQTSEGSSNGKIRTKKRSTKIDMTPMVDLAFLLLTFFILTTTFNDPYVIPLPMPDGPQTPMNDKNILNVVLAENNKVYWWDGLDGEVQSTDYSTKGIREVLQSHTTKNSKLMVLIKPFTDDDKDRLKTHSHW